MPQFINLEKRWAEFAERKHNLAETYGNVFRIHGQDDFNAYRKRSIYRWEFTGAVILCVLIWLDVLPAWVTYDRVVIAFLAMVVVWNAHHIEGLTYHIDELQNSLTLHDEQIEKLGGESAVDA